MDGLLLERLPVPGTPPRLRIDVGDQRAFVVSKPADARYCADLIAGLEEPPPDAVVKAGGAVRLVPAEGGLLPHLTVLGNVVHGHTVTHRVTRRAAEDESRVTAARCGLEDVLDRYPHEVTPGRRRLAGVARALRAHPAAIVLEDAAGLPTWGSLLRFDHNPELWSAALLLITTDPARTTGFRLATD
jgi:ABC-type thiamine transport system ATPase subunit